MQVGLIQSHTESNEGRRKCGKVTAKQKETVANEEKTKENMTIESSAYEKPISFLSERLKLSTGSDEQ
jgi:hypothetical protein